MAWSRLELGVGLVALGGIDLIWPEIADLVDVVEVEPQTIWLPAATEDTLLPGILSPTASSAMIRPPAATRHQTRTSPCEANTRWQP